MYSGGTDFVSQTPFAEMKNLYPSFAILAVSTLKITGFPWRAPTFFAVATSHER
jgi:hypothetical protein